MSLVNSPGSLAGGGAAIGAGMASVSIDSGVAGGDGRCPDDDCIIRVNSPGPVAAVGARSGSSVRAGGRAISFSVSSSDEGLGAGASGCGGTPEEACIIRVNSPGSAEAVGAGAGFVTGGTTGAGGVMEDACIKRVNSPGSVVGGAGGTVRLTAGGGAGTGGDGGVMDEACISRVNSPGSDVLAAGGGGACGGGAGATWVGAGGEGAAWVACCGAGGIGGGAVVAFIIRVNSPGPEVLGAAAGGGA